MELCIEELAERFKLRTMWRTVSRQVQMITDEARRASRTRKYDSIGLNLFEAL